MSAMGLRHLRRRICTVSLVAGLCTCLAFATAARARAEGPWWSVRSETVPTNLAPGEEGEIDLDVSNLGDAPVVGSDDPVHIRDVLPPGLTVTGIGEPGCTLATLECEFKGVLYPYEQLTETIDVKVAESPGTITRLPQTVTVEGGGAPALSRTLQMPISGEPAGYGVASLEVQPFNADGTPATQAGAHPYQLTTTVVLNQKRNLRLPVALPKDFAFHLPPGFIGDPSAAEQCTMAAFFTLVFETNQCPPGSVIGVATAEIDEPKVTKYLALTVPVFNLVPAQGEPARFGFEVAGKVPVVLDTSVRSGSDYGVDVTVKDATQTAGVLASQVTIWGVPGEPRHNASRGWECIDGELFAKQAGRSCPAHTELAQSSFLTLPSSCATTPAVEPTVFSMSSDSWANPGTLVGSEYLWSDERGNPLGFQGCAQLPFAPTIDVAPEQRSASTPTGLSVDVRAPQSSLLESEGLAEADVRDTEVTLPQGAELSPSAANGLVGCPEGPQGGLEGVGFTGFAKYHADEANPETTTFSSSFRFTEEEVEGQTLAPSCPDGSKVGTVEIETPLLPNKLTGDVYLAEPAPNGEAGKNPFNSLVALYIVAKDPVSGVLVKLAGEGVLDEHTLLVKTVFRNAPEVPFSDLKLHLFGGPRASLSTPATCGSYATNAVFTPWSGTGPLAVQSPGEDFQVTSGAGGSGCPGAVLPFNPGFSAYSTSPEAGKFTGFQLELTRPDGDQALSGVSLHLPAGVAALLSSVELCSEAQAAASACPAGSEIGKATAIAGLGSEPYVQEGGRVFITGPYDGAPFGLEIVAPADAGPFNLGYVTVRSKLYVDRNNASVSVRSDPLPTQIRGIPLQLKRVLVTVDRPRFQFNPTSCDPTQIEGAVSGSEAASVDVSARFQVGNCQSLPFTPRFTAGAVGHGSKADGTTFKVVVTSGGVNSTGVAQAGIAKVDLQLPKQLSSRLPTLQKACVASVFEANPASCPEGSVIGAATIHTPVLKNPLSGPAYLVSHGNAAFPDVEFVLQGEGVELVLDGKTDIKQGVTYSKFESTPDAPFTTFETILPAGPHGVLTPNVAESKHFSLCGETLVMPTTITAQNGKTIEQNTKIAIEGCVAVKSTKLKKLTRAQLLKRALTTCRKQHKHNRHERQACERRTRKRYATKKSSAAHRKPTHTDKKRSRR